MCHAEHEQTATKVLPRFAHAGISGSSALAEEVADAIGLYRKYRPEKGLMFQGRDGRLWSGTFIDCRGDRGETLCRAEAAQLCDDCPADMAGGRVVPVFVSIDEEALA